MDNFSTKLSSPKDGSNHYPCSRYLNRALTKWKYSEAKTKFLAVLTVCLCISTPILVFHGELRQPYGVSISSAHFRSSQFFVEPLDRLVRAWHFSDGPEKIPKMSSYANKKWKGYAKYETSTWSETYEEDADSSMPGALGVPVELTKEEKKVAERLDSQARINLVASEKIGVNRSLPDFRHEDCKSKPYPSELPLTTVIIIFNNEALSTILRTLNSIINRSPRDLLREIILVDDQSEIAQLKGPLDSAVKPLSVPVKIVRNANREGLIRARLIGAKIASTPALVFLDAHVEVSRGWLPPLLAGLDSDRTRLMQPVIDDIDHDSLAYDQAESDHQRGGLDWKFMHSWINPLKNPDFGPSDLIPTPIIIGCAFAVDREYFFQVGSYDSKMQIWGGENVEQSVRFWRCGGSVVQAPCSHVGHVYRTMSPHSVPGGIIAQHDTAFINTLRFAKVWTDQYVDFYREIVPGAKHMEAGDVSARLALKKEFQCHSFDWFLEHVYPDHSLPANHRYFGEIRHAKSNLCLDGVAKRDKFDVTTCHGLGGYQSFVFSKDGRIKSGYRCLQPLTRNNNGQDGRVNVTLELCDYRLSNESWKFELVETNQLDPEDDILGIGRLVHSTSGLCLSFDGSESTSLTNQGSLLGYLAKVAESAVIRTTKHKPILEKCDYAYDRQLWVLEKPLKWRKESDYEDEDENEGGGSAKEIDDAP